MREPLPSAPDRPRPWCWWAVKRGTRAGASCLIEGHHKGSGRSHSLRSLVINGIANLGGGVAEAFHRVAGGDVRRQDPAAVVQPEDQLPEGGEDVRAPMVLRALVILPPEGVALKTRAAADFIGQLKTLPRGNVLPRTEAQVRPLLRWPDKRRWREATRRAGRCNPPRFRAIGG
jgi:hypothetical protein